MKKAKKDFPRLGLNIKNLRKAFGETQADLANGIGLTNGKEGDARSTVSNYERGKRVPEREVLSRIAKHYKVTEDELLYGDFAGILKVSNIPVNEEFGMAAIKNMFPIICTPTALKNSNFQAAYKTQKELLTSNFDIEELICCAEKYKLAWDEGVIEGAANHLSILMFLGFLNSFLTPRMLETFDLHDARDLTAKKIFDASNPSFDEDSIPAHFDVAENRVKFLEESELDMFADIFSLRTSKEYRDLGDYYLALRHVYNLVDNSLSKEMNATVGREMLLTFSEFGNKYCKKMLQFTKKLGVKVGVV